MKHHKDKHSGTMFVPTRKWLHKSWGHARCCTWNLVWIKQKYHMVSVYHYKLYHCTWQQTHQSLFHSQSDIVVVTNPDIVCFISLPKFCWLGNAILNIFEQKVSQCISHSCFGAASCNLGMSLGRLGKAERLQVVFYSSVIKKRQRNCPQVFLLCFTVVGLACHWAITSWRFSIVFLLEINYW